MSLVENYLLIQNNVKKKSENALLVCVSKTKPIEDLIQIFEAGATDFGENYIEELIIKAPLLPKANFHLIGHIQTNKIPKIANIPNLKMIQTIDSIKLAELINKRRNKDLNPIEVLIQVNTSGEPQKFGLLPGNDVFELCQYIIKNCSMLIFKGLMTIGECNESKRDFEVLIKTRDSLAEFLNISNDNILLSMGMSSDYELALQMGANIVRVGSSIFGIRNYNK